MYVQEFADNKSLGRAATLNSAPNERYVSTGASLLTDGVYGPFSYSGGEWIGWQQEPMDVVIDMGGDVEYSSVGCNMMIQMSDDIFPPASVTVLTSQDGTEFTQVGVLEVPQAKPGDGDRIENYTVNFPPTSARWVRVVAQTASEIPVWHPAHGRKPFIFVDEIAVN
jgi:hexosaminidase